MKAAPVRERGAALPETAIVLSGLLALIFGVIQIGVIGFLQMMADGAAFIAAHEYALGSKNVAAALAGPFPQAAGGSIYVDQNNADDTTVPVDFQYGNQSARRGGLALLRAQHFQVSVHKQAPSGFLGISIGNLYNVDVHGTAIEPNTLVSNRGWNLSGVDYNSAASYQSQVGLFDDDENVPPNYVSNHLMFYCPDPSFGTQCSTTVVLSLGTAEFLDSDNWNRPLGVASNGTFAEMLCHQQKFAQAAALFPADVMPQYSAGSAYDVRNVSAVIGQIYSWDIATYTGGYSLRDKVFGRFPLHPLNYC